MSGKGAAFGKAWIEDQIGVVHALSRELDNFAK